MFIKEYLRKSVEVKEAVLNSPELLDKIQRVADLIVVGFKDGKKLLVAGNGGSASDSQHFVCELVSKFQQDRKALPAIALIANTSIITAVANDFGFANVFSKQIEALGNAGDVFVGITTSGKSENILSALKTAKAKGLSTVVLTGDAKDFVSENCDIVIKVPSVITSLVQETHITIIHAICAIVEKAFV